MKSRDTAVRAAWWERAVLAVLSVVLWWAVYWRVTTGYGAGSGVVAATCIAWAYVLVSYYAAHILNARTADRPSGPQTPTGRWPGARP